VHPVIAPPAAAPHPEVLAVVDLLPEVPAVAVDTDNLFTCHKTEDLAI